MSTASIMRLLRLEFGISIVDLAKAAGVTHQYVSGIELGKFSNGAGNNLMQQAFKQIVAKQGEQARLLSEAYARNRNRLLEFVEEPYEL